MSERKKKQTEEAMTTGNEDGDSEPGVEYRTTWKEVKIKTKANKTLSLN